MILFDLLGCRAVSIVSYRHFGTDSLSWNFGN